jgi:SOS-response transcriptional repressor LexA
MMVLAGSMAAIRSDYRNVCQRACSDNGTCGRSDQTLQFNMLSAWVKEALRQSGISGAELARQLTARLGRSIDRAAINKMQNGVRRISADELLAIADITGATPPVETGPSTEMVPLLSWVQAGHLGTADGVMPFDEIEQVPFAGLPPGEWIALRVQGDSMDRISPPDSLILVNRSERGLIAGQCYIFTDGDGATTYKRYRPSPRRLEPFSTNPEHEPIFLGDNREPKVIGRVRYSLLRL